MREPFERGAATLSAFEPLADAFGRYAELLVKQLEALDAGDLDAFAQLASARDAVAHRIDTLEHPADVGDGDPDVEEVRRQLRRCAEMDARLRQRLAALRTGALDDVRDADRARSASAGYGSVAATGSHVDFTF
jgi:hypothetical protein